VRGEQRSLLISFERAFIGNESGATAIEYGLIAAGISVVESRQPTCGSSTDVLATLL
jgi:hypothetical protein